MMRQNTNKIKQDDISYYDCLKKSNNKQEKNAVQSQIEKEHGLTMGMCWQQNSENPVKFAIEGRMLGKKYVGRH